MTQLFPFFGIFPFSQRKLSNSVPLLHCNLRFKFLDTFLAQCTVPVIIITEVRTMFCLIKNPYEALILISV